MRALVTGAAGFVGSHLVDTLLARGDEVVAMDVRPVEPQDGRVDYFQANLLQPDLQDAVLKRAGKADVVFHLGAIIPWPGVAGGPTEFMTANCTATLALLAAAAGLKAKSFVYMSSLVGIGLPEILPVTEEHPLQPRHSYNLSKICGEFACEFQRRTTGLPVTSLRLTSPYGPGMGESTVLPIFVRKVLNHEPIQWNGSGQRSQNFVFVEDVVQGLLAAARTERPGVYNLAGPESIGMKDLAQLVKRLIPDSPSTVSQSGNPDPQEHCRWEISLQKLRAELPYDPRIGVEEGLRRYIGFLRSGEKRSTWYRARC